MLRYIIYVLPFNFQYEAVVTPGNEDLVHHMEVYICDTHRGQPLPSYSGSCNAEDKPSILDSCKHVIGAWAMGAEVRHWRRHSLSQNPKQASSKWWHKYHIWNSNAS